MDDILAPDGPVPPVPPDDWFPSFTPSLTDWRAALAALDNTGDGGAAVAAETASRIQAVLDEATARATAVAAEATARAAAVASEAAARSAGDAQLNALITSLTAAVPTGTVDASYVNAQVGSEAAARTTAIAAEASSRDTAIAQAVAAILLGQGMVFPAGVDPTGTADSTAVIQAAIDTVQARPAGGIVQLPAGVFRITRSIVISRSGVTLQGVGTGAFHDVSPLAQSCTMLMWGGAAGGVVLVIGPTPVATSQKLTGITVKGLALQGTPDFVTPGAAYGMIATSVQHSFFDLYTVEFTTAAVAFTVVGSPIAEAGNSEGNTCSLRFRQQNQPGTALQLGGSSQGNSCFNTFPIVYGYTTNGIGIDFQDCDNNYIERAWIDRVTGGTGTNVYFRSNAGLTGCARANVIVELSGSVHTNQVYAEGTEKAGATQASYANRIERWDGSNAGLNLIRGTGATIFRNLNTSPIGMLESIVSDVNSGHETSTTGIIQFWGVTGNLGAGISTYPVGAFGCSRVLEVSATPLSNNATPGTTSCTNWNNRSDGQVNVFDLYTSQGGYFSFRGRAQQ